MTIWFDPTGRTSYGIGICDRCKVKMSILDLLPDPNAPGLRVCKECRDIFDPYRLPARQSEVISLPFARPDEPLTFDLDNVVPLVLGVEGDLFEVIGTEGGGAIQVEGVP